MSAKRLFSLLSLILLLNLSLYAQNSESVYNLDEEIKKIDAQIQKAPSSAEKLPLLEKKAKYEEASNLFEAAEKSYFQCAQLAQTKDKYRLILAAVRCSLSYGNSERADELLAKIASGARSNEYAPTFKLYAVWSWLSKCQSYEETYEPVAILKSYLELESMNEVKTQILFTLWFVTGQIQYARNLKDEFPQSLECAIVQGRMELAPSPFWYFVSRRNPDLKELEKLQD
ncbi:MAG: hypothetical protein K5839_01570 [Treponemataceae bacterium]|nr:hypothetical protein [Treponemataceae bacterium]